jgi:hypothetical protein
VIAADAPGADHTGAQTEEGWMDERSGDTEAEWAGLDASAARGSLPKDCWAANAFSARLRISSVCNRGQRRNSLNATPVSSTPAVERRS